MAKDAGMTQDEGRRAAAGGRGRNSQLSGRGIWYPQEQRHGSFTMTGAGLGLSTQLTCGAGRGRGLGQLSSCGICFLSATGSKDINESTCF